MPHKASTPAATRFFKPATLPASLQQLYKALAKAGTNGCRRQAALAIIHQYYRYYSLPGVRQDMWQLLAGAMANVKKGKQMKKSKRHRSMLFFYEFTLMLVDAGLVISEVTKDHQPDD